MEDKPHESVTKIEIIIHLRDPLLDTYKVIVESSLQPHQCLINALERLDAFLFLKARGGCLMIEI
jgi:hypothetical protein